MDHSLSAARRRLMLKTVPALQNRVILVSDKPRCIMPYQDDNVARGNRYADGLLRVCLKLGGGRCGGPLGGGGSLWMMCATDDDGPRHDFRTYTK